MKKLIQDYSHVSISNNTYQLNYNGRKINKYLSKLEEQKGIEILLACETGSRAWGFPSSDSDYDIRIIYKHRKDWYLSLSEKKDTIELFLENNEIDISGWDLRKSLRLLSKSNAALIERIQSPIVYRANSSFLSEIKLQAKKTYSKISTLHHYLSMAKNIFEEVEYSEEYKLKKFFYALRCSVSCLWILDNPELPPIEFEKTLDGVNISTSLRSRITELIQLKSTISESYFHKGEEELIAFIKNNLERATSEVKDLPGTKGDIQDLNEFFIKTLG